MSETKDAAKQSENVASATAYSANAQIYVISLLQFLSHCIGFFYTIALRTSNSFGGHICADAYLYVCTYVVAHKQNDVAVKMDLLWKFLKPISFALIGKEVDFAKLDGMVVTYGAGILIAGSAVSLPSHHDRQPPVVCRASPQHNGEKLLGAALHYIRICMASGCEWAAQSFH